MGRHLLVVRLEIEEAVLLLNILAFHQAFTGVIPLIMPADPLSQ